MIDTYTVRHISGPCHDFKFPTTHLDWNRRGRIQLSSGERIQITLFGHGADLALDVTSTDLLAWITARGATTNYPNAPIMFGGKVAKGYLTIDIKAMASHGLGDRSLFVKLITGVNAPITLRTVRSCADLTGTLRVHRLPSGGGHVQPWQPRDAKAKKPNLLPFVSTNLVLTRPITPQVVDTPNGRMRQVSSYFGDNLPDNVIASVPVPKLVWGVSGVNNELVNTQCDAQLIDVTDSASPRVLDTLNLPSGFPEHTPLVTKDNYPGRTGSIRVINNPLFPTGTSTTRYIGCFTEPGSTQLLDPMKLMVLVDSTNQIDEGSREADNELRF